MSSKIINGPQDPFFANHYDSLLNLVGMDHPLYGFIMKYCIMSPYSVLIEFLKSYLCINNSAMLEIGCHVGGGLRLLSPYSEFVFGLDISFLRLFYASCILKHLPRRMESYSLSIVGNIVKKRRILIEECKNITLVVGSAENIPLKESCLSVVVSNNVFDLLEDPIASIKESERALSNDGLFLFSSCYGGLSARALKNMRIKINQTVWERIKEVIDYKMKALEVRDNIPWFVRSHERSINIYNNHCFCAKKLNR